MVACYLFAFVAVFFAVGGLYVVVFSDLPDEIRNKKGMGSLVSVALYILFYKLAKFLQRYPLDQQVRKFIHKYNLKIKL